jgi:hypothetical protein
MITVRSTSMRPSEPSEKTSLNVFWRSNSGGTLLGHVILYVR